MSHSLRQRLQKEFPTDADLVAFVLDSFPEVARKFTDGMNRVAKTNLLLEHASEAELEEATKAHASGQAMPCRRYLRQPVDSFVGRQEEVEKLVAHLRQAKDGSTACISGIRGLGGIGKTELGFRVAAALRTDFPIQILVELRGQSGNPTGAEQALRGVLQFLRPTATLPGDLTSLERLYGQTLSGLRVLVLADDALDSSHVMPLHPPSGCALLVTTRNRFDMGKLKRKDVLDLGALPRKDAVELLRARCGRLSPSDAGTLAERCGDLPKALQAAAGLLEHDPTRRVSGYLRELHEHKTRLSGLRDPDDPGLDVEATLALSYDALSASGRETLRQLAVMPASFSLETAELVVNQEGGTVATALAHLYKRCLVEWAPETDRYQLHDLVRALALSRLEDAEAQATQARHARHFAKKLAEAYASYRRGHGGVLDGLRWVDTEREHLFAAQAWAAAQTAHDPEAAACCVNLLLHGGVMMHLRLSPVDRLRWSESALKAVRQTGDRIRECTTLHFMAIAHMDLGHLDQAVALCEQSLGIARETGNRTGESYALNSLGRAYGELEQAEQSLNCYKQALVIFEETGDNAQRSMVLNNLGSGYERLNQPVQAIIWFDRSLSMARATGDRYAEAFALYNLAVMHRLQRSQAQAIVFLEESLQIREELRDPRADQTRQMLAKWRGA